MSAAGRRIGRLSFARTQTHSVVTSATTGPSTSLIDIWRTARPPRMLITVGVSKTFEGLLAEFGHI